MPVNAPAPKLLPSLLIGGPFHATLGHLGMLGADRLPRVRTAFAAGAVAWGIGALLALAQWYATRDPALLAYFLDASPVAHALVAVPVLIGIERTTELRLQELLEHPVRTGLLVGPAIDEYRRAVEAADRRSSSAALELALLATAVAVCALLAGGDALGVDRWSGGAGGAALSWPGVWLHVVVGALLVFLLLRWLARFVLWTLVLARLARLPLEFVPTHPDRAGGLGFVTAYPMLFDGFVFGSGAAIGAKLFNAGLHGAAGAEEIAAAAATWLAIVLVLLVGPLTLFWMPLARLREAALLHYGAIGLRAHRRFWRSYGEDPASLEQPAGMAHASSVTALNALFDRAAGLEPLLVTRALMMQVGGIALVPLVPAIALHLPVSRLMELLVGKLG